MITSQQIRHETTLVNSDHVYKVSSITVYIVFTVFRFVIHTDFCKTLKQTPLYAGEECNVSYHCSY